MKMFNPPHPGEVIADALEELGLDIRDLARELDVVS
ncbi:transcriptional regulator [Xenorhabdus thuongxuanensis]|uniref:Transcriptional regulator n=1 Tax=Xenorhabdus thuongxuanensis TaxID=1873484 RepID=A0A1Q5TSK5_9GAMM|nr:transcriptional regulator [Xenorhabdus thuongxuanensis]